jgi:hypothetical protein
MNSHASLFVCSCRCLRKTTINGRFVIKLVHSSVAGLLAVPTGFSSYAVCGTPPRRSFFSALSYSFWLENSPLILTWLQSGRIGKFCNNLRGDTAYALYLLHIPLVFLNFLWYTLLKGLVYS